MLNNPCRPVYNKLRVLHIIVDNLAEEKLCIVSNLYGGPSNHHFSVSELNTSLHNNKNDNNKNTTTDSDL